MLSGGVLLAQNLNSETVALCYDYMSTSLISLP